MKKVCDGIAAGLMISIGGCVYMSCDPKYVGAILFSAGLLTICIRGYSLFTGKVGFLAFDHGKEALSVLFLGLLGNFIATVLVGLGVRIALPNIAEAALAACQSKLTQTFAAALIRGILCGVLMYAAVSIYKSAHNIAGIILCIPVFIISGFEHSIADMFYFAASGIVSLKAFGYIWIIILGNAIGALILPCIEKVGTKECVHE